MLTQFDILMRADVLFRHTVGRYYGGVLTAEEIEILVPPKKEKS